MGCVIKEVAKLGVFASPAMDGGGMGVETRAAEFVILKRKHETGP